MFDLNPEIANRDDSRFWCVDRDSLMAIKPGDTVIINVVAGEKFGIHDRVKNLGLAATFLGEFLEDEEASIELAGKISRPGEFDDVSPEQAEDLSRMPYFRAHFEGVGEVTFCGMECYWSQITEPTG